MNQPYPGGYPQQPGGPGQFGQPGPYGAPGAPGAPGYGYPQAGFAPRKPSTAMAYVTAIAFLPAVVILYISATVSTDSSLGSEFAAYMRMTLTGLAFVDISTDIVDAIIAVTFSYASTLLLFVGLLFARLGFARWIAAGLGFLGFAYYLFAPIKFTLIGYEIAVEGQTYETEVPFEYMIFSVIVAVVLLAASIMAVLPATGCAMRGGKPKQPQAPPGYGPPGYGPPGYGAGF
ncbi:MULTISPECIES: hypothetical protein [Prauserella salsuginis group]|uniref:Uncharacterized protein n=1 Tax=Prauserella salsuginis TaxID=387889 RepID=A0ABW6G0D0_9PSEU|nr:MULTISPECIES: hypothetical protein [Prauserella salsuginis group]MCR3721278.1 hypothetical protein [Prauserella flava]MCR3734642.1 hypothetical protein [Prauserella salsuginis]